MPLAACKVIKNMGTGNSRAANTVALSFLLHSFSSISLPAPTPVFGPAGMATANAPGICRCWSILPLRRQKWVKGGWIRNDGREGEKKNEELWIFEVSTNGAEGFFSPRALLNFRERSSTRRILPRFNVLMRSQWRRCCCVHQWFIRIYGRTVNPTDGWMIVALRAMDNGSWIILCLRCLVVGGLIFRFRFGLIFSSFLFRFFFRVVSFRKIR